MYLTQLEAVEDTVVVFFVVRLLRRRHTSQTGCYPLDLDVFSSALTFSWLTGRRPMSFMTPTSHRRH